MRSVKIEGFEDRYIIYESGVIISSYTGNPLYQYTMKGYKTVNLFRNKGKKAYLVHRLVATHFIPNPNSYKYVNHKNGDKGDNNVGNLEWCTQKHNMNHFFSILNNTPGFKCKPKIRLKKHQVIEIINMFGKQTLTEIAKKYNVTLPCISQIYRGRSWKKIPRP